MKRFLFVFLFVAAVGCGRSRDTVVLGANPNQPTQPQTFVCECYDGNFRVYGPSTCTVAIGSHDRWNRLYYDIQQYPAMNWVKVYGSCTTR